MGLSIVANGIRWKKGENIVLNDMEFPANVYPWQVQARKYGLEIRVAKGKNGKVPFEEYEKLVDDNTKVITVSWVEFQNGFRHNLKELSKLAHNRGVYLVVDGIQGVGMLKMDVKKEGIDFLACGGHKWLISPIGLGFLYIKKELLEGVEVTFAGWRSHKDPDNFSYSWFEPIDTAKRFDGGSPNVIGAIGMKESVSYLLHLEPKNIEQHALGLASYLVERLNELSNIKIMTPLDANGKPKSAIVSFSTDGIDTIYEHMRESKIIVSLRLGAIRVASHLYNTRDDIDQLIDKLTTFIPKRK